MVELPDRPRVVIRLPNWLGDAVMAVPAVRDLRRHFAGAHLAIACPAGLAPFGTTIPGIDQVVPLEGGARLGGLLPSGTDVHRLREGRFDVAVLLTNSFASAWLVRAAGVPARWGYRRDFRGPLLTRAVRRPRGRSHQGRYYLTLMERLGIATGPLEARVTVPDAWSARARGLFLARGVNPDGECLVGVAPGASNSHAKQWPPAQMADLIRRLRMAGIRSVIVGTASDRDAAREIESRLARVGDPASLEPGKPPVDLVGSTDLGLLMGVMGQCRAFVSNDSGAMHLAAAIGVPVVAVFGPTDERATAPLGPHRILTAPVFCRPCHLRDCPIDHRCMKRVTVDMVFDAVADSLGGVQRVAGA